MKKNSVLVTGCSSGFGKLTVLKLARAGFLVYATARNLKSEGVLEVQKITQKEKLPIEWYKLDVTKQNEINLVFDAIKKRGIDILINNAGFGILGPLEKYSTGDFENQFNTNFFGVVRMTYKFLPLLNNSSSPKIITISSIAGLISAPAYGLYASSKHALEIFIETLRYELFATKIKVSLIEPGGFDTNFTKNSQGLNLEKENINLIPNWYKHALTIRNKNIGTENNIFNKKRDPQLVANLVLKIAKSKNPKLRYIIGQGANLGYFLRKILPSSIWEKGMIFILRYLSSR